MRDKRDVMRLHIKNGIRDLDGIRENYNSFGDGGGRDVKIINDSTQVVDAIGNNVPNNVGDRIRPIEMSDGQYYEYLKSIQPESTIKPLTSEQKREMDVARDREYWTSDLYANQRIADAKSGISGITAITSKVPGPVGVASRIINVGLDIDQLAQNKDL